MIIDLREQASDLDLAGAVCVVGTGPAGTTLALELAARGIEVILLEAGGRGYEDATQALYDGPVIGHGNTDIASSRLRQFGGTSGHWTGRCAPLDPIDFEARDGVPHSGWPIGRTDLDPFYARAHPYLDLGPYDYGLERYAAKLPARPLPLDPAKVVPVVYQQSPPTRFAEKFMTPVEAAAKIRCVLHANLTDIRLAEGSDAVERVEARTLEGRRLTVKAERFVIACGGVENARILLNCRGQRPAGLGNEHDLVGRYFMDHMNSEVGALLFADETIDLALYDDLIDTGEAVISVGMRLDFGVMRAEGLRNNATFLVPEFANDTFSNDFRNHGWVSFSAIAKAFARGTWPDRFLENYCNAVDEADTIAIGLYRHAARRFAAPGKVLLAKFRQDAEQAPNPQSRVLLTDVKDPLGWQRAALDWRITDEDLLSLRRTHALIGEAVGAAGLGRVQLGIGDPPDLEVAFTGYHHIGTTRMHDDPAKGVVDRDCRLHSVRNLYMAGSSVFTTAGTANPTLTITALAIRLADHLAGANGKA